MRVYVSVCVRARTCVCVCVLDFVDRTSVVDAGVYLIKQPSQ